MYGNMFSSNLTIFLLRRRGRENMVVEFTNTYAISIYHH